MAPDSTAGASSSCNPAPYGRACVGCSRAKCKCFYRSDGSECERCHRLGKTCEPALAVRKRKARTPPPPTQPPSATRLEEKLDDLVTLLRAQAGERQPQAPEQQQAPQASPGRVLEGSADTMLSTLARDPDVVIDTATNVVHLLRPASPHMSLSPVLEDVSVHEVPDRLGEEQLGLFRRVFVPMFPFIHIPTTMSAAELRLQKPCLWLVIMSLTTKSVSQQFTMGETIWQIISRRIVSQHLADLDLLLGVVCFASWSHYFKKDKPFMTMLAQLAVSLVFELGIHNDVPTSALRPSRLLIQQPARLYSRTMEERRTLLAVFHLSSSCLRLLNEGSETHLDFLLATQIKCQIITNQLTWSTQLYLRQTELKIRESLLARRREPQDHAGFWQFLRLQDLDSVLDSAERWLAVFSEMPLCDWAGVSVDVFSQFTQCLVALFRLATLDEPGWDLEEVRRRADVFEILDRSCETIDRVPAALGITDAEGPRRGLFFKTAHLLRVIKALFLAELPVSVPPPVAAFTTPSSGTGGSEVNGAAEFMSDALMTDDVLLSMLHEDILAPTWDFSFRPDGSYLPFVA
ncbi:hypothetical protein DL766_003772 [Monosporascus sp. MC13-8B]|uniref:Zn(2)-C6 fungal-type domain-containing protein n=1 Tax=Monosporascus cannonballus TaxID=155416 RepID=A0ABY0H743_9PEZI|nr:hypothetical protein DL762_005049 [Monosporascus cannonballus]RYP01288.1 hypothetical protein DL763_000260 [Monosporascus cannonballus]RYP32883.1 hypothetical protein DL766_003772 [Monosporascus sp. MC13-8B]